MLMHVCPMGHAALRLKHSLISTGERHRTTWSDTERGRTRASQRATEAPRPTLCKPQTEAPGSLTRPRLHACSSRAWQATSLPAWETRPFYLFVYIPHLKMCLLI